MRFGISAILGVLLTGATSALATPTQNLQYLVLYKGSYIANPEKAVSEVASKEQRRLLITDVEADHKDPAYLILKLTDRQKNKHITKRWYLGNWRRADRIRAALLGKAKVVLYDPIHTYSYHEMKIGLEGRTDVMPLLVYVKAAEEVERRNHQLQTGDYSGNLIQQVFDWYYGVGVYEHAKQAGPQTSTH